MTHLKVIRQYLIFYITAITFLIFIIHAFGSFHYQHFSIQSQSFLHGKLNLPTGSFATKEDFVFKNGKYYWPQGPFPSVLIIPFQLFLGPAFNQWPMQIFLFVICLLLLWHLIHKYEFNRSDGIYLLLVFFVASPIVNLITNPSSSQYAQIVTVTLLLTLIVEYLSYKRPFIMGFLTGAILASRPTAAIFGVVILFDLFRERSYKKVVFFVLPITISLSLLFIFNFLRFGNILDNGYMHTITTPKMEFLRNSGLFSFKNILGNFYYYFLAPVKLVTSQTKLAYPFIAYNPWGLSFFITSPFFLYTLVHFGREFKKSAKYWFVILITLLIELSYYHPGYAQFGPRYSADFFPILFLILLISLKKQKLSDFQKNLVLLSCSFNLYLITGGLTYLK